MKKLILFLSLLVLGMCTVPAQTIVNAPLGVRYRYRCADGFEDRSVLFIYEAIDRTNGGSGTGLTGVGAHLTFGY